MIIFSGVRVIPTPLVSIQKAYQVSDDGAPLGTTFNISLIGKLTSTKGSPKSGLFTNVSSSWAGNFWTDVNNDPPEDQGVETTDHHFQSILRKQEHLRSLFSYQGAPLIIRAYDSGSVNLRCNPRIKGINFAEGNWVHTCDYTVDLEADVLYSDKFTASGEDSTLYPYVSEANEEWNIERGEAEHTYRLTHNISAKGKRTYESGSYLPREAWQNARLWVQPRLGMDTQRVFASGVLNLPITGLFAYSGYNHVRSENIGELNGTYSVSETWLVSSGAAIEDFTVSTRDSIEDGLKRVTVDGKIDGLELRDSNHGITVSKYHNANAKYNNVSLSNTIFGRAEAFSGVTLNPQAVVNVVGRNPVAGVITYNFEYSNRAGTTVSNALSESVEVIDINQNDVFARIPVLGRNKGPVLQAVASGEKNRTLNIEIVVTPRVYGGGIPAKPDVKDIIIQNIPAGTTKLLKEQDEEAWNYLTGRFRKTIKWVYEV